MLRQARSCNIQASRGLAVGPQASLALLPPQLRQTASMMGLMPAPRHSLRNDPVATTESLMAIDALRQQGALMMQRLDMMEVRIAKLGAHFLGCSCTVAGSL
jgi:hypothetical protein